MSKPKKRVAIRYTYDPARDVYIVPANVLMQMLATMAENARAKEPTS